MMRPTAFVRADQLLAALDDTPLAGDVRRVQGLNRGAVRNAVPIFSPPPPDGHYAADIKFEGVAVSLKLLGADGKPKAKLATSDAFKLELAADRDVFVEVVCFTPERDIVRFTPDKPLRLTAGKPVELSNGAKKEPFALDTEKGNCRFIVFVGLEEFAAGELSVWTKGDEGVERLVHRGKVPTKFGRTTFAVPVE